MRIMYLLAATAIAGMVSCSKQKAPQSDTMQTADTSVVSDSATVAPKETVVFVSDEMKALGIRGNVSERSEISHKFQDVYSIPAEKLSFTKEGRLVGQLAYPGVKKNADGYYVKFKSHESDGTEFETEYLRMNPEGYPVKAKLEEEGPMQELTAVFEYSDYKYDSVGNWISRKVNATVTTENLDNDYKETNKSSWVETVTYKYY